MGLPSEWLKFAPKPRQLTGNDKWNVFLSYRSVSRTWVLHLYDVLHELGHTVFLDQYVLKIGDPLMKELQTALATSQAGILIWSNASSDSEWVAREYETLENLCNNKKGFQFVPIKLDSAELPLFVERRIFLDFSSYPEGPNGGELLRLLHAVVGVPLSEEAVRFANEQDEAAMVAAARITAAIKNKNYERLLALFNEDGLPWRSSAALGCKAAEGLTRLDRNDEAIEMLIRLEQRFPKCVRPRQLHALALARRGHDNDLDNAQEILGELYASGQRDPARCSRQAASARAPGSTASRRPARRSFARGATARRCGLRDRGSARRP